uniref:Methyltransf_11 domain-containing protein n=1 Tax=Syphacia muris TaxID=451379 RepID=A0A0N5ANR2_9BILA
MRSFYYALPVRSITGFLMSYFNEKRTEDVKFAAVDALNINKDSNVLEIGYGRGNGSFQKYMFQGLAIVLDRLRSGKGHAFGIENSLYLEEVTQKRFILEIKDDKVLHLERAILLNTLPYPTDFFDGIFHVDSYYFWGKDLYPVCHDLWRVLSPGGTMVCGMELNRLRRLEEWGIIQECQYNPIRYLSVLELAGFTNVEMKYLKIDGDREIQLIKASKPESKPEYFDPQAQLEKLEAEIKRDLLVERMIKDGKPVYDLKKKDL